MIVEEIVTPTVYKHTLAPPKGYVWLIKADNYVDSIFTKRRCVHDDLVWYTAGYKTYLTDAEAYYELASQLVRRYLSKDMKPFNLDEALAGNPVCTRDGRLVTNVIVTDANAPKSAKEAQSNAYNCQTKDGEDACFRGGLTASLGKLNNVNYYHDGIRHLYGIETGADLFMLDMESASKDDLC